MATVNAANETAEKTDLEPLRRNVPFLLLWSGSAVSALGTSVSTFAYPLLVLSLTGSPLRAGLVAFLATLPSIILQLPAGALVDRLNRRSLMLVCDLGRAAVLGSIAATVLSGHFWFAHVAAAALVEGALSVPHRLCSQAAVRNVVPDRHLHTAYAQNETRDRAALMLGAPLGGTLFAVSRWMPFLLDAASYLVSAISLLFIRVPFRVDETAPQPEGVRESMAHLAQGVRWINRQPFIRTAVLLVGASNLLFQALSLVVIAKLTAAEVSAADIGYVMAAAGVGGTLGALAAPRLLRHMPLRVLVPAANWAWALLIPLVAICDQLVVLGLLLALIVFVGPLWNIGVDVHRLALTPDELQGRVSAAAALIESGTIPLGALGGGLLADALTGRQAVLALAAGMALTALVATLSPAVRRHVETP
ncbi:MFS transporter [Frankia sp. AiPa1]|uniref:MFS transporter n=1 Tax=Frankia sp. AiPa1 TaxID=573492 RepID=UPI00202B452E|nr:MFS transporter [Frankia sp. AiPa1]